jgi:hypothetical protein
VLFRALKDALQPAQPTALPGTSSQCVKAVNAPVRGSSLSSPFWVATHTVPERSKCTKFMRLSLKEPGILLSPASSAFIQQVFRPRQSERFLASLNKQQRDRTMFAVDDWEWRKWMNQHFTYGRASASRK